MPTFNFRCQKCSDEFSAKIPFGSKDYPKCEECGGEVEKLLTPPMGIMFKGSGFYKTDSSKTSATSATSKPAEKKGETTEAKPKAEAPVPKTEGGGK